MDYTTLNNKLIGGNGGEGVLIEEIAHKFDVDSQTGDDLVFIELMGTAKTVLKDAYNPLAGFDDIPESLPVKDSVKIVVKEGGNDDNEILFGRLNRQFNLQPPLEDTPDVWERFLSDSPDSVVDQIKGKAAYFKVALGKNKTGDKWSEYYTNLMNVAQRETDPSAVRQKMAAIKKKQEDKRKAKEKAEAEFAGTSTSDEPIPF